MWLGTQACTAPWCLLPDSTQEHSNSCVLMPRREGMRGCKESLISWTLLHDPEKSMLGSSGKPRAQEASNGFLSGPYRKSDGKGEREMWTLMKIEDQLY